MSVAKSEWNGWRLSVEDLFLLAPKHTGVRYEIDLRDCTDSAAVLDWILQLKDKPWVDDAILAGFVHALDDVLFIPRPTWESRTFPCPTSDELARRFASVEE